MLRISSRDNARLKAVERLLTSSRDRRKAGKCVLEGEHLVEAYAQRYGAPESIIVADSQLARPGVKSLVRRFDERTLVVPEAVFRELAVLPAAIGVLAVVVAPVSSQSTGGAFCLVLDDVQDPGNVGSMLRSAAAAGVSDAFLSPQCVFAWSPKVLRAGMGAHFHLQIHENVDLPAWAGRYRSAGGQVAALVRDGGASLYETPLQRPLALAIGNEGAGLSGALLDAATARVTIPMPGHVESLNAAAAAAVALFECVRRLR